MSITNEPTEQTLKAPCCPHCHEEMPNLGLFTWSVPPAAIVCVHCPGCGTALHFTMGQMPPSSAIARPH